MARERRGIYGRNLDLCRPPVAVMLHYELPLSEIVMDFFDQLKSIVRKRLRVSFDYRVDPSYKTRANLVKLEHS